MTAFDQFQLATVLLGEGDRNGAAAAIQDAIDQIDRDGVDVHMRDDLVSFRSLLLAQEAAQ